MKFSSILKLTSLPFILFLLGLVSTPSLQAQKYDDLLPLYIEEMDKIIVGSLNWKSIEELPNQSIIRKNSKAVGYLGIPSRGVRCTAFLIGKDKIMTNHHCIKNNEEANGAFFIPNLESEIPKENREKYSCQNVLLTSSAQDFTILKCDKSPGVKWGYLSFSKRYALRNRSLYVIHQNCDYYYDYGCTPYKKYSAGKVLRGNSSKASTLSHNADTLGGSSGSPIFDRRTHKVIGLHNRGIGGNGMGRGDYNSGVGMTSILSVIRYKNPLLYQTLKF